MLSVQMKLPRRTVVTLAGESVVQCDLACVDLPSDETPDETAVVMFSRTDWARRFIESHDLHGWLPAFIAYAELRDLLIACHQNQGASWGVVDFFNDTERQLVKTFRLESAITAIDSADLETDDPILIDGHCFAL